MIGITHSKVLHISVQTALILSDQAYRNLSERLMNYSTDPTVQRFLSTIVKTTSPQNAEDIIFRLTEDRMTQYDQAVSRFRYTSTCRQITEYLKRPILPADGNLPDKDLYRDSVSHDIEVFNIDSSFVEELRQNWENRTIRIFDNVACSISRDNVNAYANTIIDRKMKQYDRVAALLCQSDARKRCSHEADSGMAWSQRFFYHSKYLRPSGLQLQAELRRCNALRPWHRRGKISVRSPR